MQHQGKVHQKSDLETIGIRNANTVWWNLSTPALYEHAVDRHEGLMAHLGPFVVQTGEFTGRSPKDKYIVREPSSLDKVGWGEANRPFDPDRYERLRTRFLAYIQTDLFVQDCYVGADHAFRLPVRVITELAWHNLFARNMFIRVQDADELARHEPAFTVIDIPGFRANPETDGTRSEAFILVHFGRREVLIGGTSYAGEIKKSLFSVMNFLLPLQSVLPMHCSAGYGRDENDVALFFGLSGTGKTTLSADPERTLIGDDEHGWSDRGIFNFEGGCYAKVIKLSREGEPEIYETTRRYGTILENVAIDAETRALDLDSDVFTENTRASYPISHIPNATRSGLGGHPRAILFLTADAFGVLPPVARLTPAQAVYHFLSGYTAKVAGTERGVTEPQATFSTCFGAPFMAMPPAVYAELLHKRLAEHGSEVWLVNTGWSGGPYGVGQRIKLSYTRAMVRAAISGTLGTVAMRTDPIFGLQVPTACPDVPNEILDPRATWRDASAYDAQARKLQVMFEENFEKYAATVSADVRAGLRPTR